MVTSKSHAGPSSARLHIVGQAHPGGADEPPPDNVAVMTDIYREMFAEIAARPGITSGAGFINACAAEAGLLTVDYARFCKDEEGYRQAENAELKALGIRAGRAKHKLSMIKGGKSSSSD